jgi:hypothetical protein
MTKVAVQQHQHVTADLSLENTSELEHTMEGIKKALGLHERPDGMKLYYMVAARDYWLPTCRRPCIGRAQPTTFCVGDEQDGGGQPPLPYNNAAGFLAAWNTAPSDQARNNLEQEAVIAVQPRMCSSLLC